MEKNSAFTGYETIMAIRILESQIRIRNKQKFSFDLQCQKEQLKQPNKPSSAYIFHYVSSLENLMVKGQKICTICFRTKLPFRFVNSFYLLKWFTLGEKGKNGFNWQGKIMVSSQHL